MIKKIIFGIKGTELSAQELKLFKENPVYGFILFARNIKNREQVKSLTASLKNLYPERFVPIFTDQEGGKVARLKPPVVPKEYPSVGYFSEVYQENKNRAKQMVRENYYQLMHELKELGINSPLAPVADLLHAESNKVIIGSRSFGDNVTQVTDLASEAISAIIGADGVPCVKHIPGHGRATLDSHFDLPIIRTSRAELENSDFAVFSNLAKKTNWAMIAHIVYQTIDPEYPATISKKMVKYIREKIGFQGNLVTDDICMYALHGEVGKKLACLKRVIKLIEQNQEWRKDFTEQLSYILDIDINSVDKDILLNCQAKIETLQPEFLASLNNIVKIASDNCDYILHCSGNITEMQLICEIV